MNQKNLLRNAPVPAITLVLSITTAAHAAGGEGGFWAGFTVSAVNSVVLFGLLGFLLRKPLSEYFVRRSTEIRDAIEAAGKARADAEQTLAEAKQKVANADAELAALRKKFENDAKAEREHLIREAEKTADRIISDANLVAEGERDKALVTLRAEANRLATELAEKKVREKITADDQARLAGDFVSRLGGVQ